MHVEDTFDPETGSIAPIALDERLRALEVTLITWALKASNGNKSKAARLLTIKRSTLGDRITRCGLRTQPAGRTAEPCDARAVAVALHAADL